MEEELYLDIRLIYDIVRGFPGGTIGKKLACLCRRHKRHGLVPWVRKIPWRRAWQPAPVFLPGKLPCTKESSRLYSIGSQRVRHNWSHLPGTHTWHSYMRQVKSWRGWAGSPSAHPRKWLSSVQFSHSVVSNSLWYHGLQHARPPCPSLTPGACSNSCPLSLWCHSTISSSVIPFSSHIRSFQMIQFFASGGQRIRVSPSASVLPMNIQDWFPSGGTGWISLQSKSLSRVFSNATVQKHQFFRAQLSFFIFKLIYFS